MYKGEVNVSENQLPAFLETAEALKIKGEQLTKLFYVFKFYNYSSL